MDRIILTYDNIDYELELADQIVKQNKKFIDPADPKSIKSPITKTVKIPKSRNNLKTFEFLGVSGGVNSILSKDVKGRLLQDNICTLNYANVYLKDNGKEFELILKGGNGSFFDLISEQKLTDLSILNLTDLWNQTKIIEKMSNTTGVIYPIVDWGVFNSESVDVTHIYPMVYAKDVFDAIFKKTNNSILDRDWSYVCDAFDETNISYPFNELLITIHNKFITAPELLKLKSTGYNLGTLTILKPTPYLNIGLNADYDPYGIINYSTEYSLGGMYCAVSGEFTVRIKGDCNLFFGTPPYDYRLLIYANKNFTAGDNSNVGSIELSYVSNFDFQITFNAEWQDYIFLGAKILYGVDNFSIYADLENIEFEVINVNAKEIEYGIDYPIGVNLPDISQMDFIKNIMYLYGLTVNTDFYNNTVIFRKINELNINLNKGNILDISNKIDNTEKQPNEYLIDSLAKKNLFLWKKDYINTLNEETGSCYFTIDSIRYENRKNFIVSDFAFSQTKDIFFRPNDNVQFNHTIPFINILKQEDNGIVKKDKSFEPRFFKINKETSVILLNEFGVETSLNTDSLPVCEPLFWQNIVNEFWNDYIIILQTSDTPQFKALLTLNDFINFDFLKPIFIENYGYYFVYDISNFQNKKVVTLKTMKLY